MDIYKKYDAFIRYWNKRMDISEMKINGEPLQEVAVRKFGKSLERRSSTVYFSIIEKDRRGLAELIFGMKNLRGKYVIQLLSVISEKPHYPALIRNMYYSSWGIARGYFSFGYDGKGRIARGVAFDYESEFYICNESFPIERFWRNTELITLDRMVSLDPTLKYCAWHRECGVQTIEYIKLYRRYPQACEMLMKLKLYRFLNENAIEMLVKDPKFARWVAHNSNSISSKRMAPQTAHNAYKKNPGGDPGSYYDSLQYRCECGRLAAVQDKRVYAEVLKHTTQERLAKYIKSVGANNRSYSDYLIACDWLGLDLSDTKVLFPRDFKSMHDDYVTQYAAYTADLEMRTRALARIRDEQERAEADRKYKEELEHLPENLKKAAEKFSFLSRYRDEDYIVMVAQSKEDLIHEGAVLNHCVGKMNYDLRMAREESIICFIRRSIDPTTPFVTAEVKVTEQTLRIAQCYGYDDKVVPEIDEFKKAWMSKANRTYRKMGA